jgi:hypothetical protein
MGARMMAIRRPLSYEINKDPFVIISYRPIDTSIFGEDIEMMQKSPTV